MSGIKGRKQVNRVCRKRNAWVRERIMAYPAESRRETDVWELLRRAAFHYIKA